MSRMEKVRLRQTIGKVSEDPKEQARQTGQIERNTQESLEAAYAEIKSLQSQITALEARVTALEP